MASPIGTFEEAMTKRELKTTPKISVKIWRPIITKLDAKIEAACLRRDAYLARVLEVEVEKLDEEISIPNSEASYDYVAARLDQFDRKLVSLALPQDLTASLTEVCDRKNIVRDAFFNRLFLLLAADPKAIDSLYFNGSGDWRRDVWSDFKGDGPFFHNGFYPLEPEIDPFWALRKALDLQVSESEVDVVDYVDSTNGKEVRVTRELDGVLEPLDSVYARRFEQHVKGHDLIGLSCYLPDRCIPGHEAQSAYSAKLDEILQGL